MTFDIGNDLRHRNLVRSDDGVTVDVGQLSLTPGRFNSYIPILETTIRGT
jgi:hypothetical protein